ncbi:MAG: hypothetical protein JRM74_04705 [Nitrososphaerota archaeon]|nr:hypothetical protein [Nitrososphaerota archaeon]
MLLAILLFYVNRPLASAVQVPGLESASNVTHAVLSGASTPYQVKPLGPSPGGLIGVDFVFVGLTAVATAALAFLIRGRKDKLWLPMSAALCYGGVAVGLLSLGPLGTLPAVLAPLVLWTLYVLSNTGRAPRQFSFLFGSFLTAGLAVTCAIYLPLITLIVLPVAYAAWDAYAVFRGPLAKTVSEMPDRLERMFLVNVSGTGIGFGDLFFYSLMASIGLLFSPLACLMASAGVVAGFSLTFALLRSGNCEALPALPLPLAFSLVALAAAVYL